jgi:hypothetical protein
MGLALSACVCAEGGGGGLPVAAASFAIILWVHCCMAGLNLAQVDN